MLLGMPDWARKHLPIDEAAPAVRRELRKMPRGDQERVFRRCAQDGVNRRREWRGVNRTV